ncbi:DUF3280 domain-containing protein [Salipiger sp. 1_MG-2023]|uniref:DUF3280 domain-containing protein n=1 Tax=Salipiger sp. 1_MG-2023 TaxID=3062665 RepID=UPI0026E456C9|nr:DUF3280 domain-containing protein [Salipiger sp. 1_MG-2023]MDO6585321.1 DUF3280 domain-containing protein [Salipiger sp. 1_MG-2023]
MLARLTLVLMSLAMPAVAGGKVAFFGLSYLDDSLQTQELGQDPAELQRLAMLTQMVRDRFSAAGYDLVDLAPVQGKLDGVMNPAKCYGCDTRMAAELGADFSLVGEVQKVSNLILSMNLQMRAASTGEMVKGRVVDIRGNTDESWRRGMEYILRNTFFREEHE